jgi:hypothetical protein
VYEFSTPATSPMIHTESIGLHGYRITVVLPCEASMQAALSALLKINPEAYTPERIDAIARDIVSMQHPDRAVYGGEPFIVEPIKAGGTISDDY